MPEYIEKTRLLERLTDYYNWAAMDDTKPLSVCTSADCLSIVEGSPSADVVEVVRCKDCKFWDAVKNPKHAGKGICTPPNRSLGGYCTRRGATLQDDYCSFGERKEGDDK